jgi:hypothetical protein
MLGKILCNLSWITYTLFVENGVPCSEAAKRSFINPIRSEAEGDTKMVELNLPRTVAGYAEPMCPHCDKVYGPDMADQGPVQCSDCGTWFEVTSLLVFQVAELLDYKVPEAEPVQAKRSATAKRSPARKRAAGAKPAKKDRRKS